MKQQGMASIGTTLYLNSSLHECTLYYAHPAPCTLHRHFTRCARTYRTMRTQTPALCACRVQSYLPHVHRRLRCVSAGYSPICHTYTDVCAVCLPGTVLSATRTQTSALCACRVQSYLPHDACAVCLPGTVLSATRTQAPALCACRVQSYLPHVHRRLRCVPAGYSPICHTYTRYDRGYGYGGGRGLVGPI